MPSDNKIPERIRQAKNLRFERIKRLDPETFCDEVAVFAENSNLNNPKTKLFIRFKTAKEELDSIIGQYYTKEKILDVLSALYEKETSVNLNQTADNLNKILENPEKYNLTPDEANQVAENFVYMVTKDEQHNPLHNSFDPNAIETHAIYKDLKAAEEELSQMNEAQRMSDSGKVNQVNKLRAQYSEAAINQFNTVMLLATPEQKEQIKAKFESDYPELFNDSLSIQQKQNAFIDKSKLPPPSPPPPTQPPVIDISRKTLESDSILKDLQAAEAELFQMNQAQRMSDPSIQKEVENLRNRYNTAIEKENKQTKPEVSKTPRHEPHRREEPKSQAEAFLITFNSKLNEITKKILPDNYEIVDQKTYQHNIKDELSQMSNSEKQYSVPEAYGSLALGINILVNSNENNLSNNRDSLSSLFSKTQTTFYKPQGGGGGGGNGGITTLAKANSRKIPSKVKNSTIKKLANSQTGKFVANAAGNVYVKAAVSAKNLINGKFNKNIAFLAAGFLVGGPLGLASFGLVMNARFRAFIFKNIFKRFLKTLIYFHILLFILVPLILVIINNSAYMVPPTDKGKPMQADAGIPGFLGSGIGGAWPSCWPTTGYVSFGPVPGHNGIGGSYQAIDIANSLGTPIYATHDGLATNNYFPFNPSGFGNNVYIQGAGIATLYAHLDTSYISGSQQVLAGQIIGTMGHTGHTIPEGISGTHLHYEVVPASIGIDSIVPSYTVGYPVDGCFASSSGGGTSATCERIGSCRNSCLSNETALTAPPDGWSDCTQTCCSDQSVPQTPPDPNAPDYLCKLAGGSCFPEIMCPPEGILPNQSAYECPASAPICCNPNYTNPTQACLFVSSSSNCVPRADCPPGCDVLKSGISDCQETSVVCCDYTKSGCTFTCETNPQTTCTAVTTNCETVSGTCPSNRKCCNLNDIPLF